MNEFYTAPTGLTPLTTARSANENSDREAVEAAFDKLPTEADQKRAQFGTDGSAVDTLYLITTAYDLGAYVAGMTVKFEAKLQNTGAASIQVNGGANVSLLDLEGSPLLGGEIRTGQIAEATYSATTGAFQLVASTSDSAAAVSAAAALVSETNAAASALLFNDVANHFYRG